jgi:hypothetical protein
MSQRSVERVLGRLVTDEGFRRRFAGNPDAALGEMAAAGLELTPLEAQALAGVDARMLERIAGMLDPRLQKIDCCGGRS